MFRVRIGAVRGFQEFFTAKPALPFLPTLKSGMLTSNISSGRALLLKIIGNTFVLNMVESLAEGHTLADKTGLGNDNLHKFIETMFPGRFRFRRCCS